MEIVAANFRARNGRQLQAWPDQRLTIGRIGAEPGEEVVVRCRSSGAVEIHCHGGHAAAAMIETLLFNAGCGPLGWKDWVVGRQADPIAAAAQVALAEARSQRAAAILLDQYHGALRRAIDDIAAAVRSRSLAAAKRQIDALLARARLGCHLIQPWQVVVAGRPNVGKSSLINALVGFGRSLVHPAAGTTRDVVTVRTALDGWPVELADTAGLWAGNDALERAGVELARERLARADLVLLVFDGSVPWSEADAALLASWPDALVVHNKSDLSGSPGGGRPAGLGVSALMRQGLSPLVERIVGRLVPAPPPAGAAVPFTEEQVAELRRIGGTLSAGG
jgi:tRNA modification GTPase